MVLAFHVSTTSCVPVPESAADCGLPLALSAMESDALRVPLAAGVNMIAIVHVLPAASDELQVLFWLKSPASEPVKVIPEMFKVALPVLSRVTDSVAQDVVAGQLPNATLVGETVAVVLLAVAVPDRLTLCGLPVPLSVTLRAALRAPLAVGVNVTLMVQLAPAATLDPQLLVWPKSPALVPPIAMLEIVRAVLPVFVRVTLCAALVDSTA